MAVERVYLVTYDIADPKRWRRIYRIMEGFGHWLQLSVFQCRLTARRRVELSNELEATMNHSEDHILIFDLGLAEKVELRVESLGRVYEGLPRRPTIV